MILNYYHAIELMSSLPVLLSNEAVGKVTTNYDNAAADQLDKKEDAASIVEMWGFTSPLLEVNGADFY